MRTYVVIVCAFIHRSIDIDDRRIIWWCTGTLRWPEICHPSHPILAFRPFACVSMIHFASSNMYMAQLAFDYTWALACVLLYYAADPLLVFCLWTSLFVVRGCRLLLFCVCICFELSHSFVLPPQALSSFPPLSPVSPLSPLFVSCVCSSSMKKPFVLLWLWARLYVHHRREMPVFALSPFRQPPLSFVHVLVVCVVAYGTVAVAAWSLSWPHCFSSFITSCYPISSLLLFCLLGDFLAQLPFLPPWSPVRPPCLPSRLPHPLSNHSPSFFPFFLSSRITYMFLFCAWVSTCSSFFLPLFSRVECRLHGRLSSSSSLCGRHLRRVYPLSISTFSLLLLIWHFLIRLTPFAVSRGRVAGFLF